MTLARRKGTVAEFATTSAATSSAALTILLSSVFVPASSLSFAMEMTIEGSSVIMSGSVVRADCDTLESILSKNSIKLVVLKNSGGGDANAGYCVGALVRRSGLSTVIRGRCASSCSRMWLGGVERTLDGPNSRVGLHGNYDKGGGLLADAPTRLRAWIPQYAPTVDRGLMEQWIHLPVNKSMMNFYNGRAELCDNGSCSPISGRNALNAGLSTK
jgi:hypothetical protein